MTPSEASSSRKLCRAIYVAAQQRRRRPRGNMRLRYAIDKARSFSCPKDNIERSIKKATGELGAENFEEVVYEGYGPGGVAVLCEALTDNRNRTAGELRRRSRSAGGNLGASGCVSYLFNFKGLFVIDAKHVAEDRLMEVALEAGADDVAAVEGYFEVTCDPKLFETVRKALEDAQDRHRDRPRPAISRRPPLTSTSRTARRCSSSRTCSTRTTTFRTSTPTTISPRKRWRLMPARVNSTEPYQSGLLRPRTFRLERQRTMATTPFVKSERLRKLPPYLFAEIDKKKKAAIAAGRDVINLGVGDPDRPTPPPIIKSLQHHAENPAFHQYALDQGRPSCGASIAAFCKRAVRPRPRPETRDPAADRLEGGDRPLPAGRAQPGRHQPGARPLLPGLSQQQHVRRGRRLHACRSSRRSASAPTSTPSRPTSTPGPADVPELSQQPDRRDGRPGLLREGRRPGPGAQLRDRAGRRLQRDVLTSSPPPSILQVPGAKDVAIEFHSLSKTFNMTGWRVGFAIGGAPMIAALGQVKANTDSGIFTAIQFAGKTALDEYDTLTPPIRALYKERRDAFVAGTEEDRLGRADAPRPPSTSGSPARRATPRPSSAPGCSTRPTS